jgi:flagella basal body P-ring formation protein FlgA
MTQTFLLLGLLLLLRPQIAFTACRISTPLEMAGENSADKPVDQSVCDASASSFQNSGATVSQQALLRRISNSPVALQRTRRPLTPDEIEKAIRFSLGPSGRDAQIRILDFDRNPVEAGTVQFATSGAVLPDSAEPRRPFIWRGMVLGELGNDEPCWARVQIVAIRKVVRTRVRLLAGDVLDAGELEVLEVESSPLITPKDEDISDYVGLLARRGMPGPTVLNKNLVETAPLVRRGSIVRVTAVAGQARITLDGEAHSDGRLGQGIQITNARTGRSFFGIVNGKGSVLVEVSDSTSL